MVLCGLVGTGDMQAACGRGAGRAQVVRAMQVVRACAGRMQACRVVKLLVDVVCNQRVRLLDGIHLRFPGIGIIFGVNL